VIYPATARPVLHVMLYGDKSGLQYGWATPAELTRMLAGAGQCPAPPGERGDRWLVPAPEDYEFWLAWFDRRGRALEWIDAGNPPEPAEFTFYMGTHMITWLWDGQVDVPLCVSYSRFRNVKTLHRGRVPWILDSGAYTELTKYGTWTITPEEYVRFTARADQEIGGLQWAGAQDWPCGDIVLRGGQAGRVRAAGTGLTEDDHRNLTVENFTVLTGLWPQYSDRPCPFIPTLQGSTADGMLRCYDLYHKAGILLGEEYPVAGVGSVVYLQAAGRLGSVARAVRDLNLGLHWFGLKLTGLAEQHLLRDITSPWTCAGTQSGDSMTWSFTASREGRRHPDCTHLGRRGQLNNCANCARFALWHRATRIMPAVRAATSAPARVVAQGALDLGLSG